MASNDFIDDIINDSYQTQSQKEEPNININDYSLLIFSDGAHERTKQRSTFGLYIQCLDKSSNLYKFNKLKIIKKINKDLFCYNLHNINITHHSIFNTTNSIYCNNENCTYYGVYNYDNINSNYVCKNHKNENMKQSIQYFSYDPSNIRAEGYGILYSLILIKLLYVDKLNNVDDIRNNINNINIISELKCIPYYEDKNKKYDYCLIVTDSEFWINVITKWSNNWFKTNKFLDKKNIDIVYYINYFMTILINNNIFIKFQFVRGHSDKNKKNKFTIFEKGNIIADKLANIAKNNNDFLVKISN